MFSLFFHRWIYFSLKKMYSSQFQTWNENKWIQFYFPPNFFLSLCFINEFYTWKIFFKSISWYFNFLFYSLKMFCCSVSHIFVFTEKHILLSVIFVLNIFVFKVSFMIFNLFYLQRKNILFLFCFFKGKKSPRNVFFSWNFFITSIFSLFVLWNENVFSSWKKKISRLLFHLVLTRDTRVSTAAAADSSFTPQDAAGKQVSSAESTCWQNPGQPHPNVSN